MKIRDTIDPLKTLLGKNIHNSIVAAFQSNVVVEKFR